jgi:hypothetical protein
VYDDNAMSNGMVWKWVRMFNEDRENLQDEVRSGRPSLVKDYLVRTVNEKPCEDRRFRVSGLFLHFLQLSRTLLYDIVRNNLGCRKLCAHCVSQVLSEGHNKQPAACASTFLMPYQKKGDDVLSYIATGDETWVSHITQGSEQQSLQWKYIGSPKEKKFKSQFQQERRKPYSGTDKVFPW